MPTSLSGEYWFDTVAKPTIWDGYFEAYRQGKQIGSLCHAITRYRNGDTWPSLNRLRTIWLNSERLLNREIEHCAGMERSTVFDGEGSIGDTGRGNQMSDNPTDNKRFIDFEFYHWDSSDTAVLEEIQDILRSILNREHFVVLQAVKIDDVYIIKTLAPIRHTDVEPAGWELFTGPYGMGDCNYQLRKRQDA